MSTPRLLDPSPLAKPPHRADPVVAVITALLMVVIVGLFVAGVLAVYTWSTPDSEWPALRVTGIAFGVALILAIGFPAGRHLRSRARS